MNRKMVSVKASGTHNFKEDNVIAGYLRKVEENVGEYKSTAYTIEKEDGESKTVWGNTSLNGQMANIGLGTFVEIEFLGQLTTKKGKPFNDYDVRVDSNTLAKPVEENANDYIPD